jgi:RNA polymerase sigma-70 factor (ECF subfamily)
MHAELITDQEDAYLTILEIETLIKVLTAADIFRLSNIAKQYKYCLMDADELLNEAIVITASGKRKFRRTVPLVAFLAETMWSIASNEKRKLDRKVAPINDDPANDPILNLPDKTVSVENEAAANQELEHIYELFKDDDDVTMLLMGIYDGLNPDEICKTANWSRTTYNSVRKKLRRGLNNHFPLGRTS